MNKVRPGLAVVVMTEVVHNTQNRCDHCNAPLNDYIDREDLIVDHCQSCSESEDRIAWINTVYLFILPLPLLLLFYSSGWLAPSIYNAMISAHGIYYYLFGLIYYSNIIFEWICIISTYIVYPIVTFKKINSFKKLPNFKYLNTIARPKVDSQTEKSSSLFTRLIYFPFHRRDSTLTVRAGSFLIFGYMFCFMIIPFLGLLFVLVIDFTNLLSGYFLRTLPLREFLQYKTSSHVCHLRKPEIFLE